MELKILGTQSPVVSKGHNGPGILIKSGKNKVMLDCGSGTHSLLNLPNDLENLSVILTNLHWDHCSDIFNLQYGSYCYHNLKVLEMPINIYMPEIPFDIYKIIYKEPSYARYERIKGKKELSIGNMKISFLKTENSVDTYAVKIQEDDKNIVYAPDTSNLSTEKFVTFSKNADLLICESGLLEEYNIPKNNSHLTTYQIGELAKMANAKGLMLTHFWHEEEPERYVKEVKTVFPKVIDAKEGQVINILSKNKEKEER